MAGDLEKDPRKGHGKSKGRIAYGSTLTLMVVRGVGAVRRFEISPRLLLGAFLFFTLYILVSVLVINQYLDLRRENRELKARMVNLGQEADRLRKDLYRNEQQVRLLEEYLSGIEKVPKAPERGDEAAEKKTPSSPASQPPSTSPPSPGEPEGETVSAEPTVEVQDFTARLEGGRLTVAFKVVNRRKGGGPVRGYVHMVAVNRKAHPAGLRAYPQAALRNGRPVNFRRGQIFFIKRFKTVRGVFRLDRPDAGPSAIQVFIYNHDGRLLLEKEFALGNDA